MGSGGRSTYRGRPSGGLVGQVFDRLTVIKDSGLRDRSGAIKWECACACGNTVYVRGVSLKRGEYRSCGCWTKDRMRRSPPAIKHGGTDTGTYRSWAVMKRRCIDTRFKDYAQYGGRGITVCDRWLQSFANFYEDMGERPEGKTLDRIDSNGGYCKENCRWATRLTQGNNTRRNHLLAYGGSTNTLAEWSRITGISYTKLRARINVLKWPVAKALEKEKTHVTNHEDRKYSHPGVRVRPGVPGTPRIRIKRVRQS